MVVQEIMEGDGNNMKEYIWLLPVVFMFHDMEEIVGIKRWISKYGEELENKYKLAKKIFAPYKNITTEGFALAVYEELIVLLVICVLAQFTNIFFIQAIWFGGVVGFTLHLVIHLLQAIAVKKYTPALITSIISLPISLVIVTKCTCFLRADISILGIVIGIVGVGVNLKIAHKLMKC